MQVKDETRARVTETLVRKHGALSNAFFFSLKAEIHITNQLAGVERKPLNAG